jgi:FkbM family methyltransferase
MSVDQGISNFRKFIICLSAIPMVFKVVMRNLEGKKFEVEVSFLKKILNSSDVCLDIGGAYGRYAYPMSRMVKDGNIMSFEPGQFSFFVLSVIKVLFGMSNVRIFKKALGKENKKAFLISPIKSTGKVGYSLSYISETPVAPAVCESIEIITIDGFMEGQAIGRLDFIKCDTEGAEMMIFLGGSKTIEKHRPIVLSEVEDDHLSKFGYSPKDVETFFRGRDYEVFQLRDGHELVRVASMDKDSNYFFIPKEKLKLLSRVKISL